MPTGPNERAVIYGVDASGQAAAYGISAAVQATQTLTLSGNAVAGETFTINGRVYPWVATLSATVQNQVKIGASASDSCDSAIAAINHDPAQDGILYSLGTAINADASAATGAGDTVVFTARASLWPGATGNILPVSETMSSGSWGAAVFSGGTNGGLSVGSIGGTITLASTNRVWTLGSTISASGTIGVGAQAISITWSTDFVGSIGGLAIDASTFPNAGLDGEVNGNDAVGAGIAFTRSAGTIYTAIIA